MSGKTEKTFYPHLDKLVLLNQCFEKLKDKVTSLDDIKFKYLYECLKRIRIYHGKLLIEKYNMCQLTNNSNLSQDEKNKHYFDISMYDDIIDICKTMVKKCEKSLEEIIIKLSKPTTKTQSGGDNSEFKSHIINFYADWCGACKGFKSTWNEIEKHYKNKNVTIQAIECGSDESLLSKYSVIQFPTIRVYTLKGGKKNVHEYQGQRTVEQLKQWIDERI
jgi:thiol-disulfide isomerase/thioredoxin